MACCHLLHCIMALCVIVSTSFGTPLHRRLKRYNHARPSYGSPDAPQRNVQRFEPVLNYNMPVINPGQGQPFDPVFAPIQPADPTSQNPVQSVPGGNNPVGSIFVPGNPQLNLPYSVPHNGGHLPPVLSPGNPGNNPPIFLNPTNVQTVYPRPVIVQLPQQANPPSDPTAPARDDGGLNLATLLALLQALFPGIMIPTPIAGLAGGSSEAGGFSSK